MSISKKDIVCERERDTQAESKRKRERETEREENCEKRVKITWERKRKRLCRYHK